MNLCIEATRTHFPTYGQACACKIQDWKKRCLAHSSDELQAFEFCADYNANPTQTKRFNLETSEDPPNRLTDSMYYPQVKAFVERFDRKRMLIMEFDHLVREQVPNIKAIVDFFGLPYSPHKSQLTSLPDDNTMDFAGKVKSISCRTHTKLLDLFAPMNERLYEYIRFTQRKGMAPTMEPPVEETGLGKTWASPSCTEREMHVLAEGKLAVAEESTSGSNHNKYGAALVPPQ
jgi:hypothetical protein